MPLFPLTAAEALRKPTVHYNAADGSGRTFGAYVESVASTRPAAPAAPTVATTTTGGTLGSGIGVQYSVTSVDDGIESLPSALSTLTTTGGGSTNAVQLTLATVAGAEFYNIYGRATGSQLYMMTVETATTTIKVDTGAITPAGAVPSGAITAGTAVLRIPWLATGTRLYNNRTIVAAPATTIGEVGKYEYRRV